jgi:flagellar basal body-associated protein FliL
MNINDTELRNKLREVLRYKTRNEIAEEIKAYTGKFHPFQINNFMQGKDVSLKTAIKLDEYLIRHEH